MSELDLLEAKVKKALKAVLKGWGAYFFFPVQSGIGAHTVDCLACVPIKITKEMVGHHPGRVRSRRDEANQDRRAYRGARRDIETSASGRRGCSACAYN